jgi:hypothetical protein
MPIEKIHEISPPISLCSHVRDPFGLALSWILFERLSLLHPSGSLA